ncbi:MAG: hypothetical protein JWQ40_3778 [Segetibacter sp.]|nr:hypothetical protein [Segetibacter sp.]
MKRVLLFIVMIVSVGLFFVSCKGNSETISNRFYYYPQKNVYYDLGKKNFLYSLDGGKTWKSVENPTGREPGTLGERVVLENTDNQVYNSNEDHRKAYGGILYNISSGDTSSLNNMSVTERKESQASRTAAGKRGDAKPKKGIKKLFDRIFGKKNK